MTPLRRSAGLSGPLPYWPTWAARLLILLIVPLIPVYVLAVAISGFGQVCSELKEVWDDLARPPWPRKPKGTK